jgi:hypothetical protein
MIFKTKKQAITAMKCTFAPWMVENHCVVKCDKGWMYKMKDTK